MDEATYQGWVYTYDTNKETAMQIGVLGMGDSILYTYPEGNGIIKSMAHMDTQTISKISINDGAIVEEKLFTENIDFNGADEWYTEVDQVVQGAECIIEYMPTDNTAISDYGRQAVNDKMKSADNDDNKLKISYVEASSELNTASKDHATYNASNISDDDYHTAWVEGVDGTGEGQVLVLHLDGIHKISKIKIFNGYLKTKRRYSINGKITTAAIDFGNGHQQMVNLSIMDPIEEETEFEADKMGETEIIPNGDCETDTIVITITGAVAGTKYEDTAVSEIEVYGY